VGLDAAIADLITARATRLELDNGRMLASVWERPPDAPRPAECPRLPTVVATPSP
jgi:hypothetical protein